MITRGLLDNTLITRGYGLSVIVGSLISSLVDIIDINDDCSSTVFALSLVSFIVSEHSNNVVLVEK